MPKAPPRPPPRPAPRPLAAWLLAAALLAAPPACRAEPAAPAADADADAGAPPAAAGASAARRPPRRYFLAHTQERCEVYSVEGDAVSPPEAVPCPPDLHTGERVRLAGFSCMRESPVDPARNVPVVCPDPLTSLEKQDRDARDAGF